ncbi:peptide ligase PGM1-related protein [uncultured Nocardioides sp.]|uniref:peptide ligase PGM1-related protein n=1 Tax=uncultured Nocardioides sp. TaxID=198441 RepID=UPI002631EB55|nr:peptide ligase PGM1-related protein [uncultured Nocardioides sp.]
MVVLPSYSVDHTLLEHFGPRLPALEHRQLLSMLSLARRPAAEMIFVTAERPTQRVMDYHLSFVEDALRDGVRARFHVVAVPDDTARSITAKLLDRPDLLATIRSMTRGRLAFIEPWNVTDLEVQVAQRLGLPLNGTPATLWPLGFKSSGRRLMREAGVPLPGGREDVHSVDDVLAAVEHVRQERPDAEGVVVKLDDSASGLGNRVIEFADVPSPPMLRAAVESLGPDYLADLASGGVVEELLAGEELASPSVQGEITPDGRVAVVSTHEQIHSGTHRQVYAGCRFPARRDYRGDLAVYGTSVGQLLADRGALGRFSVDFAATRASSRWRVHGLEINLRKSGTSHPLSLLHNLTPGHYDDVAGTWSLPDGSRRCYRSTDNLLDPLWRGRERDLMDAVDHAGLTFDRGHGVGAVLHMLNGLRIAGVVGLTTIGRSPDDAQRRYEAAVAAITGRGPPDPGEARSGGASGSMSDGRDDACTGAHAH